MRRFSACPSFDSRPLVRYGESKATGGNGRDQDSGRFLWSIVGIIWIVEAINLARQSQFPALWTGPPGPCCIVNDPPAEVESGTDATGALRRCARGNTWFQDRLWVPFVAEDPDSPLFSPLETPAPAQDQTVAFQHRVQVGNESSNGDNRPVSPRSISRSKARFFGVPLWAAAYPRLRDGDRHGPVQGLRAWVDQSPRHIPLCPPENWVTIPDRPNFHGQQSRHQ